MAIRRFALLSVAVLAVSFCTWAQSPPPKHPVIAVAIYSSDGRVTNMEPELSGRALRVVEETAPEARAIPSHGSKIGAASAQARKMKADFLIWIEVSPRPTAQVEVGPGTTTPFPTPERAEAQGSIIRKYTVLQLDSELKFSDNTILRPETYPLGPYFDWLRSICGRAVEDAAYDAVKKMKSKKLL